MPFKAGHVADWPGRTSCEPLPTLDGVEPHYLATDPAAAGLRNRVEILAGTDVLSDRSRRELGEVAYLLRALNPKGDR